MRKCVFAVLFGLFFTCIGCFALPVRWKVEGIGIKGRGDSLVVSVNWRFVGDELEPKAAIVARLSLRNTLGEILMRPVVVYGEKAFYGNDLASGDTRERGYLFEGTVGAVSSEESFLYESWMDTLRVSLAVYEWTPRTGQFLISAANKWTFTKPKMPEEPIFPWKMKVPVRNNGERRELSFSAPVAFSDYSTKFSIEEGNNVEDIGDFLDKLKVLTSSGSFDIKSSSLSLSLPPEGNSSDVLRRSRSCAQSLFSYLQRAGAFKDSAPERVGKGEDWDGVREWISRSQFQDDERVAEILSWKGRDDEMAWALAREKPIVWENLVGRCFPTLGRVTYKASYVPKVFYRANFIMPVFEEVPEALTPFDFYQLSQLFDEHSDRRLEVLSVGAELNTDSRELNMDAAMGYILSGNARAAGPFLRYIGESDDAKYVYACWLFYSKRYDEALGILDYLRERNPDYGSVWVYVEPFVKWASNQVEWDKGFN